MDSELGGEVLRDEELLMRRIVLHKQILSDVVGRNPSAVLLNADTERPAEIRREEVDEARPLSRFRLSEDASSWDGSRIFPARLGGAYQYLFLVDAQHARRRLAG
jgi:hypothetical protein